MELITPKKRSSVALGHCGIFKQWPIYSGKVTLIVRDKSCQRRVAVYMKLYENCPKHNAVLYRGEDCKFQYGAFDYGSCTVKKVMNNEYQFDISQTETGIGLRFEAPTLEAAEKWVESFRCITYCPYSPKNRRIYGEPV